MSQLSVSALQRYVPGMIQIDDRERKFNTRGAIFEISPDGSNVNVHYIFIDEDDGEHARHYEIDPKVFENGTSDGIFVSNVHHVTITFSPP